MSGRKVLVTGGAGFLGSNLVRALVANGDAVRVLDDASRGSFERLRDLNGQFEVYSGDVRDASLVERASQGCQVLFHLAAVNGTRFFYEQPRRVLDVALRGTLAAVEAAEKAKVERFLLASSSEVYQQPPEVPTNEDVRMVVPDPYNPRYSYGGGKLASELIAIHYLRDARVSCIIVRPHNVYGAAMGFEHVIPEWIGKLWISAVKTLGRSHELCMMSGREVVRLASEHSSGAFPEIPLAIQGDGTDTRAFCYVTDAVNGMMLLSQKGRPNTTYNVGRQEETTIRELADLLGRTLGLRVRLESGPSAKGGTSRRCPNMERLKSLGFVARVPLQEGLRETAAWYWDAARRSHGVLD